MSLRVLSEEDLTFFEENGYLVVPNVVPQKNIDDLIAVIFDSLGMNPEDPLTWYPVERPSSLVHLHQHQTIWNNRQEPRLYGAFADILGSEKLWVSLDRASMKPPHDERYPHYNEPGFVHWDLDTSKPLPARLGVQGVLALAETTPEMGGFCCVPGFHKNLAEWIAAQPADRHPHKPDLTRLPEGMKVTPIPMKAGDLVIWDTKLAHGNGRNLGTKPRLAQYITMGHASDNEEIRQQRIACWRDRTAPPNWEKDIPAIYRSYEKQFPPAELSDLGKKLLGLERWPD